MPHSEESVLTAADHTAIIEFVMRNSRHFWCRTPRMRPPAVLIRAAEMAESPEQSQMFLRAAAAVSEYMADIDITDRFDPQWKEALPYLTKIVRFSGEPADLQGLIKEIGSGATGSIRIGLDTAADVLQSGANTIYNEAWVTEIMFPPIIDSLLEGMFNEVAEKLNLFGGIAKADAAGAVAGAVKGGIRGGATGGVAGAAQGASKGAASGAIVGSITGGTGTAQ